MRTSSPSSRRSPSQNQDFGRLSVCRDRKDVVSFKSSRSKPINLYKDVRSLSFVSFSLLFLLVLPFSSSFSSLNSSPSFMRGRRGPILSRQNFQFQQHHGRVLTLPDSLQSSFQSHRSNSIKQQVQNYDGIALYNEAFVTQKQMQQQEEIMSKNGFRHRLKKQFGKVFAKLATSSHVKQYQDKNQRVIYSRLYNHVNIKERNSSSGWAILPSSLSLMFWLGTSFIFCVILMNFFPLFFSSSPLTGMKQFGSKPFPMAMAIPSSSSSAASISKPLSNNELINKGMVFLSLFAVSAALHSAETAITTLYPWKVKEFAGQEGPTSPFKILEKDITRVLTTILVATTSCTIYSAALFTTLASEIFGPKGIAYSTVGLTTFTLVFGELIPKALGVNNAELVARTMVPPINILAIVLNPLGKILSMFAKTFLRLIGVRTEDKDRVSEEELRLLIAGAQKSGGIENEEGQMINSILNMHDTKVSEVMKPRVDVEAIQKEATLLELQQQYNETKYSRIPVYDEGIDKIIGVVMSKDLLDYVFEDNYLGSDPVESIMQPTYFIPETMSVWNCFQEMRKRRNHMAIVVDEYGGTAGIVTLEDIQEEVFGEIYDEEDDEVDHSGEDLITIVDEEKQIFQLQGNAEFADVCKALKIEGKVSEDLLDDFNTFSGYLCSLAGEIPAISDYVVVHNYIFTIIDADERRILEIRAERIEKEDDDEDQEGENESDRDRDRDRDSSDINVGIYEKGNGQINQISMTAGGSVSLNENDWDQKDNSKVEHTTKNKEKVKEEGGGRVVEVIADTRTNEKDKNKDDQEFLPDELTDEIIIEDGDSKTE